MIRNRPTIALALICSILIAHASRADEARPVELRIMSFNVRYSKAGSSEAAPENNWNDKTYPRRERAIRVIRENGPDVLGVQEARWPQVEDLKEALPEYSFYGIGRDDGKKGGEFSGIFFNKDRFTKRESGSFWLSDTPEKPRTSFYKALTAVPRIASWVRLADNKSQREFTVLNMHWDHIDVPARRKSAALVRKRLAELGDKLPAIVMGDLNAKEESLEVKQLVGEENSTGRKLADSFRTLHPQRSPNESSFNGWKGTLKGSRIDYILHTSEFTPVAAEIVRTSYDGHWPSDHYPVTAVLRLERKGVATR
jgi:endonuclease/exonuclease/phosphatase family metal-dependent hydrolase